MKQVRCIRSTFSSSTTGISYTSLLTFNTLGTVLTENQTRTPVLDTIRIRNWFLKLANAPGVGKSWTFIVRILREGVAIDTDMVIVIADTDTRGSYTASDIITEEDDLISVKIIPSGTPAAILDATCSLETEIEEFGAQFYAKSNLNLVNSGNSGLHYAGPFDLLSTVYESAADASSVVCMSGRISQYALYGTGNAGSQSYSFVLVKNGVVFEDSRLSINPAPNTFTYHKSPEFTLTFEPGDLIYLLTERTIGSFITANMYFKVRANVDGQSMWVNTCQVLNTSGLRFSPPLNPTQIGWANIHNTGATEILGPTIFGLGEGWNIALSSAPGAGDSYTFNMYKNDIVQTPEIVIQDTDVAGEDPDNGFNIAQGDYVAIGQDPSGSPSSPRPKFAILQTIVSGAITTGGLYVPTPGERHDLYIGQSEVKIPLPFFKTAFFGE